MYANTRIGHLLRRAASVVLPLMILSASASGASRLLTPPPHAASIPYVSNEFGTPVTDDYHWMEKPGSKALATFMAQQNAYTRSLLASIPGQRQIHDELVKDANSGTAVFNITRAAGKVFYLSIAPGQNTAHLMMLDALGAVPRLLVDPTSFSKNGVPQAINFYFVSPNGRYVAFGVSGGGSEHAKLRVLDTSTGKLLNVAISRVQGGDSDFPPVTWLPDSKGFVYYRLHHFAANSAVTDFYQKSRDYLHMLASDDVTGDTDTPVFGWHVSPNVKMTLAQDALVFASPGSRWVLGVFTENEELQTIDDIYAARLSDLEAGKPVWHKVAGRSSHISGFAFHRDVLDVITSNNAPRYAVVGFDLAKEMPPKLVLAPSRRVIEQLSAGRHALYVGEMRDGMGRIERVAYDTDARSNVKMPFDGGLTQILADPKGAGVWFHLAGWTTPPAWYAYDSVAKTVRNTGIEQPPRVSFAGIVSKEVKAVSWDGTMVPVSILMKKGTTLDGLHPTLLIGYGSYGITLTPFYSPLMLPWLERGGIVAIAHVRGGGWYGAAWHQDGMKATKINTVFDFIAAAQYLVDHHYTSPGHLAGEGGSAGGITIGGAIAWRPDLFAAAIDSHGDTDMLRAQFTPNGPPNEVEFGNVLQLPDFHWLYAMDALVHIRNGVKYPAVMGITGANDPRVAPWQVAKFVARLQAASASGRPDLLRVAYQAGHGIGSTKDQYINELTDQYTFLFWQLGEKGFQPTK